MLPDFVKTLTNTDRLMNEIPVDFFKKNAPSKPSNETYRENFHDKVYQFDDKVRDQY